MYEYFNYRGQNRRVMIVIYNRNDCGLHCKISIFNVAFDPT
jgi:hypothetical protein